MFRHMFHAFSSSVSQAEEIRCPMESWVHVVPVLVGNSPRPLDLWSTSFVRPTTSFYCSLFWIHHINLILFTRIAIYNSNAIRRHRPIVRSSVVSGFLFPNGVTRLAICDSGWGSAGCNVDAGLKWVNRGTVNLANNLHMDCYWLQ